MVHGDYSWPEIEEEEESTIDSYDSHYTTQSLPSERGDSPETDSIEQQNEEQLEEAGVNPEDSNTEEENPAASTLSEGRDPTVNRMEELRGKEFKAETDLENSNTEESTHCNRRLTRQPLHSC